MRMPIKIALTLGVILISSGLVGQDTSAQVRRHIHANKADLWNQIINLHLEGIKLLKRERLLGKATEMDNRVKAFRQAADLLTSYIKQFVPDANSITYLRTTYRLGIYLELGNQFESAAECYELCLSHPLIEDYDAIFDGKPIQPQAKARLANLRKNHYLGRSGRSVWHDLSWLEDAVLDMEGITLLNSRSISQGFTQDFNIYCPSESIETIMLEGIMDVGPFLSSQPKSRSKFFTWRINLFNEEGKQVGDEILGKGGVKVVGFDIKQGGMYRLKLKVEEGRGSLKITRY